MKKNKLNNFLIVSLLIIGCEPKQEFKIGDCVHHSDVFYFKIAGYNKTNGQYLVWIADELGSAPDYENTRPIEWSVGKYDDEYIIACPESKYPEPNIE